MLNYHFSSFGNTNSRISFQSAMYHGVENLLELVGVVTRASGKKTSTLFSCHHIERQHNMTKQNLHIGQLIKAVFDESGMSVSEFARKIHLERSTVYSIFERQSIDAMQLARISIVLKHNFLSDVELYYSLVPQASSLTLHLDNLPPETVFQLAGLLNAVSDSRP